MRAETLGFARRMQVSAVSCTDEASGKPKVKRLQMARFRGIVQGTRGLVSRLGHKLLDTKAASWNGEICVYLRVENGIETAEVRHYAKPSGKLIAVLYNGKLGE